MIHKTNKNHYAFFTKINSLVPIHRTCQRLLGLDAELICVMPHTVQWIAESPHYGTDTLWSPSQLGHEIHEHPPGHDVTIAFGGEETREDQPHGQPVGDGAPMPEEMIDTLRHLCDPIFKHSKYCTNSDGGRTFANRVCTTLKAEVVSELCE